MSAMFFGVPTGQASGGQSDGVRILQSDSQNIVLELEVPAYTAQIVEVDDQTYQRLSIKGYGLSGAPGEPELPQRGLLLGIPPDAEVSLAVLATESTVANGFNVYPVPGRSIEPLDPGRSLFDKLPDLQIKFVKNQSVYTTDAFFPFSVAEIANSGYLRNQRYVQVLIRPIQYNPVTGELKHYLYLKLRVSLSYPQGRLSLTPGRSESYAFETVLQNSILNYETAKVWRARPQPQVQATSASLDYLSEPSYKISVAQDGIYQLTYSDLEAAGLPVDSLDPHTFQVFNIGSEVAIYVEGDGDGKFDSSDYILFYSQKMNTKYTDINVYWLTYGKAAGLRMPQKDGGLSGTASSPASFKTTVHLEEDLWYDSMLPKKEGADHWYWTYIYPPTVPSQILSTTLIHIAGGSYTCTLRANMNGIISSPINPDHHTRIYINDNLTEDSWWDGQVERSSEIDFSSSYLLEGINTIRVEGPNDTGVGSDLVTFNWFEIDYHDTYTAENDSLRFSGDVAAETSTTWEYQVDAFTTGDIEVFDITDPANVSRIISISVEPSSSYRLKLEDTITETTEYLALTTAQRLSPLSIMLDTPSDLHTTSNGADYIIITHADFYDEMLPLANHRAEQGLRTMVANVQDVYDEFSYGIFDAQAIHDFLAYAYEYWAAPALSYVLLVGDGNFDFKDNMGTGEPNYIPPYLAMVDPWLGETATDNRYACVSGDDILPDMYIGRLPVQTSAEAQAVAGKILNYEQNAVSGDWNKDVLFVADNADAAGDFAILSEDIAGNYLPSPQYTPQRVYYKITHSTVDDVRAAIVNASNEGSLLTNYIGHSAIQWWAHEKLFRIEDIASLNNDGKLPMMLPMTCYDGYFHYPAFPCLGESIVRADNKGAIASWSPTGLGLAHGHDYLNKGFFTAVFTDNIAEIGTATYAGKLKLYTETGGEASPFRDLMDTYVLFGDPFMKLNLPACDAADYDNDGRITVGDVMQVAAHWDTEWGDANF
ncbi:MAG: hypothetical protein H8D43_01670, partial [Chloroflexi bacterium]|nr:hypothetical protein [Chloroflexota bacterium]